MKLGMVIKAVLCIAMLAAPIFIIYYYQRYMLAKINGECILILPSAPGLILAVLIIWIIMALIILYIEYNIIMSTRNKIRMVCSIIICCTLLYFPLTSQSYFKKDVIYDKGFFSIKGTTYMWDDVKSVNLTHSEVKRGYGYKYIFVYEFNLYDGICISPLDSSIVRSTGNLNDIVDTLDDMVIEHGIQRIINYKYDEYEGNGELEEKLYNKISANTKKKYPD